MSSNEEIYNSAKEKLKMIRNEEKWIFIKNLFIAVLALAVGVIGIVISSRVQADSFASTMLNVFYLFSFLGVLYSIVNFNYSRDQAVKIVDSALGTDIKLKTKNNPEEKAGTTA